MYESEDEELIIRVLHEPRLITLPVGGKRPKVLAAVLEEREFEEGEIEELSRNFFARCVETNDVFYFGEDVDIHEDGEIVRHEGAWLAGQDGATPDIIMPGTFLLGARYFQEVAPGVVLDSATRRSPEPNRSSGISARAPDVRLGARGLRTGLHTRGAADVGAATEVGKPGQQRRVEALDLPHVPRAQATGSRNRSR